MTVKELMKALEEIPQDADIVIVTKNDDAMAQKVQFNDIANEVIISD